MRYTISEMASLLGVTTHTFALLWKKMGPDPSPEVNEDTGYRYYTVTDTRRFKPVQGTAGGRALAGRMPGADRRTHGGAEQRHVQPSDRPAAAQAGAGRTGHPLFWNTSGSSTVHWNRMPGASGCRNFPEMWRLTFSQEEAADRDKELQQEKAEWLECMPATRWVSRLPRRVMEQFRVGRNEYDYGLMIEADAARRLGLKRTKHVEVVCGGDYLTTIWKKDYRGSFGWDSLDDLHAEIVQRGFRAWRRTQQHRC